MHADVAQCDDGEGHDWPRDLGQRLLLHQSTYFGTVLRLRRINVAIAYDNILLAGCGCHCYRYLHEELVNYGTVVVGVFDKMMCRLMGNSLNMVIEHSNLYGKDVETGEL